MFDGFLTVDGQRRTVRPLVLLGPHAAGRTAAGSGAPGALANIERMPHIARDVWARTRRAPHCSRESRVRRPPQTSSVPRPATPARRVGARRTAHRGRRADVQRTPDVSLLVDGKVTGSIVFASDAVIAALPPGTDAVSLRYTPDEGSQRREHEEALARVADRVGTRGRPMLVWRTYQW